MRLKEKYKTISRISIITLVIAIIYHYIGIDIPANYYFGFIFGAGFAVFISTPTTPDFKEGDYIAHNRFGYGYILEIHGDEILFRNGSHLYTISASNCVRV